MDIKKRQAEIGAFFRETRIGQGLSLRDVAKKPLSYSQLSRFERGISDISTEDAVLLMARLGMAMGELFQLQAQNPYSFPGRLMDEAMVCDYDLITTDANRYLSAHVDDPVTPMHDVERIILTCAKQDVSGSYRLSIVDERILTTFLMYPASWKTIELTAIFVSVPFASSEFRDICWKRISRFDLTSRLVEQNVQMLEGMLLANVKFGEWQQFSEHLPLLLKFTDDPNWDRVLRFTRVVTELIKLMNLVQEGDADPVSELVAELFRLIEEAGGTGMLPYMRKYWDFVGKPAIVVHHRIPQNDEDIELSPHGDTSTYLARVREERHLNMNQVALAWSPSAQTRFEKGENQFGFVRSDVLKDFLLTDWGDINFAVLSATDNAFAKITRLAYKDNLNQTTAAPILRELHDELSDLPEQIAEIQELSAKIYSFGRAYETVPKDIVNHGMEILKHQKVWMTRTYALLVMCAGDATPEDDVEVWRSIVGADNNYKTAFKNADVLDFYVALAISGWEDSVVAKEAARTMLQDLPHVQQPKWITLRTFYVKIARMLCEWTIEPTRAKEDEVEHYLHVLIKLGYKVQVKFQIENFAEHFERPDFMADVVAD